MKFKNCFFYFLLISSVLSAQDDENDLPPGVEQIDSVVGMNYKDMYPSDSVLTDGYTTSNTFFPKNLDPNLKNKYKGQEFDYTTIKPRETLWDRIKRRIAELLKSIFGEVDVQKTGDITMVVLRLFAIILGAFVLYVLISYLLGKEGNLFFSKKNKKLQIHDENLNENIHEINFPEEILRFEKEGNYRYAVRYQFLKTLKNLSDKNLVDWVPEKTNRDYITEINNSTQKENFRELVRIFDYVWYGEFDINLNNYNHFKETFNSFQV